MGFWSCMLCLSWTLLPHPRIRESPCCKVLPISKVGVFLLVTACQLFLHIQTHRCVSLVLSFSQVRHLNHRDKGLNCSLSVSQRERLGPGRPVLLPSPSPHSFTDRSPTMVSRTPVLYSPGHIILSPGHKVPSALGMEPHFLPQWNRLFAFCSTC